MLKHAVVLVVAALMMYTLAGCARQPIVEAKSAKADIVWPQRPEVPRVRYLSSISSSEDIDIRPGLLRRVAGFIKGAVERNIVRPYGVTKDAEGRLYVIDTYYQRVHVFDAKNSAHYIFPDTELEEFKNPIDVVVGAQGRVYVSDSISNVIHVFSSHGKQHEGSIGRGKLKRPTGLAVDAKRNLLLVTDTLASSLVVFDEKSSDVVAVVGGKGDGKESFHSPTNVVVGNSGAIYVTDALNFRIQVLDSEYKFLPSFGSAGDSPGHFSRPKGVAIDSEDHVYVVDALFGNVQIFDADGELLLSFGKPGNKPGEFWLPNDIFIDGEDRIYISDAYNQRIQVFQYLGFGDELK